MNVKKLLTCPFLEIATIPSDSPFQAVLKTMSGHKMTLHSVVQLSKSHKCKAPYLVITNTSPNFELT